MLAQDAFAPARLKELNLSENTFNRKPVLPVFLSQSNFIPQLSSFMDTTDDIPTMTWSNILTP